MLDLKNHVSTFLKSEYSLISGHDDVSAIIVTRLICDFQRMCFIKPLGPRVWPGDDPLPMPSVYDTEDHLKKRARSVVVYPKTLRVLGYTTTLRARFFRWSSVSSTDGSGRGMYLNHI